MHRIVVHESKRNLEMSAKGVARDGALTVSFDRVKAVSDESQRLNMLYMSQRCRECLAARNTSATP